MKNTYFGLAAPYQRCAHAYIRFKFVLLQCCACAILNTSRYNPHHQRQANFTCMNIWIFYIYVYTELVITHFRQKDMQIILFDFLVWILKIKRKITLFGLNIHRLTFFRLFAVIHQKTGPLSPTVWSSNICICRLKRLPIIVITFWPRKIRNEDLCGNLPIQKQITRIK